MVALASYPQPAREGNPFHLQDSSVSFPHGFSCVPLLIWGHLREQWSHLDDLSYPSTLKSDD